MNDNIKIMLPLKLLFLFCCLFACLLVFLRMMIIPGIEWEDERLVQAEKVREGEETW